jgi:hypothetical protein
MAATARKAMDKGLSRVKKALERGENPLLAAEVDFVQTCCRILGFNSEEKVDAIGRRAAEDVKGKVRKVMNAITVLLDELGDKVKRHQRKSPGPSLSTQSYDDMDAPARSLQHLQASVKGIRDTMVGGFARGIKVAKLDLENSMENFRITVERTGEAALVERGHHQPLVGEGTGRVWRCDERGRRSNTES